LKRADIVITAIGKAEFVRRDWLKLGCVVIDVGINEKPDASKKLGYSFIGDVNYDEALLKASAIIPVMIDVGINEKPDASKKLGYRLIGDVNYDEALLKASAITAIGKAEFVRGDWLKLGCVMIDVGINEKPDASKKLGYRLIGDVNYDEALLKASAITAIGKAEFVQGDWLKLGCVMINVGINEKPDASKKLGYRLIGDVNYDEALLKASAITAIGKAAFVRRCHFDIEATATIFIRQQRPKRSLSINSLQFPLQKCS
jgi:5,10-methylene-tetrahydrofolate dehydrogenase/methenyl tetrahydrofolate cyclohydrolase